MQIDNFYSDPVPSVRNPLDSIVLSPHTLGNHDAGLAQMEVGTSDYRSVLPSIPSCEYHDQDTCTPPSLMLKRVRQKFCRFYKA